jgi:hypothetical protein
MAQCGVLLGVATGFDDPAATRTAESGNYDLLPSSFAITDEF